MNVTADKPPVADAIELSVQPRLETWDKKGDPQLALEDYLSKVAPLVQPMRIGFIDAVEDLP